MDRLECNRKIQILLAEEAGCAQQLLETLQEERQALLTRNADAIRQAANHKQAYIAEMQRLENVRLQYQHQVAEQGSFEDFLVWCDPELKLRNQWADLLSIVEDCKSTNDTNGAMVRTQHQQVQTALDLLRGINTNETVYDSSGNTNRDDPGRPLAKA